MSPCNYLLYNVLFTIYLLRILKSYLVLLHHKCSNYFNKDFFSFRLHETLLTTFNFFSNCVCVCMQYYSEYSFLLRF